MNETQDEFEDERNAAEFENGNLNQQPNRQVHFVPIIPSMFQRDCPYEGGRNQPEVFQHPTELSGSHLQRSHIHKVPFQSTNHRDFSKQVFASSGCQDASTSVGRKQMSELIEQGSVPNPQFQPYRFEPSSSNGPTIVFPKTGNASSSHGHLPQSQIQSSSQQIGVDQLASALERAFIAAAEIGTSSPNQVV